MQRCRVSKDPRPGKQNARKGKRRRRKEEKKDGEKTVHAKRMEMKKKKKKKIEQNLNTRQYNTRKMAAGMIFIRSFYTIV